MRVFAFGCSFTEYGWPTWADFVGRHYVATRQAEYYNFGLAGTGNYYILASMLKADADYQFTPDDVILVCWSSWNREDRFLLDPDVAVLAPGWTNQGNVLNGSTYDEDFIKKYWSLEHDVIKNITSIQAVRKLFSLSWEMTITPVEHAAKLEQASPELLTVLLDYLDTVKNRWDVKPKQHWPRNSVEYKMRRFDGHPPPAEHYEKAQQVVRHISSENLDPVCAKLLQDYNHFWETEMGDVQIHDQWWEQKGSLFDHWYAGRNTWGKDVVWLWGQGVEGIGQERVRDYLTDFVRRDRD